MINVALENLSENNEILVRNWLKEEGRDWLVAIVRARIAKAQCEATNLLLTKPGAVVVESQMPQHVHDHMREAAKYQLFLDVLAELESPDAKYQTVKLVVG